MALTLLQSALFSVQGFFFFKSPFLQCNYTCTQRTCENTQPLFFCGWLGVPIAFWACVVHFLTSSWHPVVCAVSWSTSWLCDFLWFRSPMHSLTEGRCYWRYCKVAPHFFVISNLFHAVKMCYFWLFFFVLWTFYMNFLYRFFPFLQ